MKNTSFNHFQKFFHGDQSYWPLHSRKRCENTRDDLIKSNNDFETRHNDIREGLVAVLWAVSNKKGGFRSTPQGRRKWVKVYESVARKLIVDYQQDAFNQGQRPLRFFMAILFQKSLTTFEYLIQIYKGSERSQNTKTQFLAPIDYVDGFYIDGSQT